MRGSPQLLTSALATPFFRPTPEGRVFVHPSLWLAGRQREYRVNDAQARQLEAGIGRAYLAMLIAFVLGATLTAILMPSLIPSTYGDHFVAGILAIAAFTVLLICFFNAMVYLAACSVLAGVPWTRAARAPYDPISNLKKTASFTTTFLRSFPTWLLVTLVILDAIGLAGATGKVYEALASGRLTLDILNAAIMLWVGLTGAAALLNRLRTGRAVS